MRLKIGSLLSMMFLTMAIMTGCTGAAAKTAQEVFDAYNNGDAKKARQIYSEEIQGNEENEKAFDEKLNQAIESIIDNYNEESIDIGSAQEQISHYVDVFGESTCSMDGYENLKVIQSSKASYEKAKKSDEKEEYAKAYTLYERVSEKDSNYEDTQIKKTYVVERDYSYIKKLYAYDDREAVFKIINDIPKNEKIVFFGDKKERLQELQRQFEDSVYLSSDNKGQELTFKQIVTQEYFDCRILFTTKVLDNGINLKDKAIKHIIIDLSDLTEFVQCLGRRRITDMNDTVTVYFYAGIKSISGKYGYLKEAMEIADEYFEYKEHNCLDIFQNKYRIKHNLPNFFDNMMNLVYPAYFKAKHDFAFYRDITEKRKSMKKEVSRLLKKPCEDYEKVEKNYRLKLYLESNVDKKYFKQDRKTLIEIFDVRQGDYVLKSRNVLNQYLKDYGFDYCIGVGTEKRKVYWVIEKQK